MGDSDLNVYRTIDELRYFASKANVRLPSRAPKAEIIRALRAAGIDPETGALQKDQLGDGRVSLDRFCSHCGVELAAGARFCSGCGTQTPAPANSGRSQQVVDLTSQTNALRLVCGLGLLALIAGVLFLPWLEAKASTGAELSYSALKVRDILSNEAGLAAFLFAVSPLLIALCVGVAANLAFLHGLTEGDAPIAGIAFAATASLVAYAMYFINAQLEAASVLARAQGVELSIGLGAICTLAGLLVLMTCAFYSWISRSMDA